MRAAIHLGLDVGGTGVKAAALDGRGVVVARAVSDRYTRPDRAGLEAAARCVIERLGIDAGAIGSLGLCVPGIVNAAGDGIEYAANVPGLCGVRFAELAAGAGVGGVPLATTTDAIAAAVDIGVIESLRGRLLAISIGTGVGAAVLDDGRPLIVSGRSCGHLGQVDVSLDDDAPIGADGGTGGLEAYIGLPALVARYGVPAVEVFQKLGAEDPPLRALARAMRIAHAIYRPDHVRILGGVGIRLSEHGAALRVRVGNGLTSVARPSWTLGFGRDDWHAAVGAARLASAQTANNGGQVVRELER